MAIYLYKEIPAQRQLLSKYYQKGEKKENKK